ncbi:basic blue protein-like [Rhodamnia argentea]|uniref:Basic blue protein n=1 Tax=Rhodamnia argentea TaxID=178133 RepID=A0A8B8QDD4_9MYRT|nr:basic blue protein-like [Rhodamnia argentea]
MISQGRGSASRAAAFAVTLIYLLAQAEHARAATYMVGGSSGWTFNMVDWPKGKSFRAGDTLIFKYNPTIHNVVVLDKGGYNSCRTPRGAKVYNSGNDRIRLAKGPNFFICNFPGHCESAMKIAVNAA